jgi:hypothetical protein
MMDVQVNGLASRAERNLEQRRAELGLIGTAPLYGLERVSETCIEVAASLRAGNELMRDFEGRRSELSSIGAAPLYGVDGRDTPLDASRTRRLLTH